MQIKWLPEGIEYFALFNCLSGYELLKVDEECRKYFGIVTPFGNSEMNGSPMGYLNTPVVYQNMRFIFG